MQSTCESLHLLVSWTERRRVDKNLDINVLSFETDSVWVVATRSIIGKRVGDRRDPWGTLYLTHYVLYEICIIHTNMNTAFWEAKLGGQSKDY